MKSYKIGELAHILDIKIDTIRYYEKIGLIPKPQRQENAYRVYSEKYMDMIKFIIICKNNGFTLKEIQEINHLMSSRYDNHEELKQVVSKKMKEVDGKIKELVLLKKQLNEIVNNCHGEKCEMMDILR